MSEQEIFLEALNLESSDERLAFIKERCGRDDALRKRLEALLQAHAETGDFLGSPAIGSVSEQRSQITEDAGTIVGPYKLLQRIGEGGFGVVYMAEQAEPVRRKVALKIIKPGMDTKEVIARFESERQALALMDHPNIARVLDAGATDSGRPYFVMELVKGVPITDFCDKNHLSVEDRMNLFIPVCLAVQHAHHKGIIHRDIKPSNVMVTLHDGKPVPKVIDFGVAKATSQQLTQKTLFTAYGQMIGTPLYMSPEQAEMSGLDIDTRSDIYSLGVLLYELLTGTTPIEQKRLREAGFAEMQRLIRDIEAPRPSTRLSSLHNDASVLISTNRGTDAKRLSDLLRGDVDWIVMKALEKDRQRRYDTPNALADDIQRFLKHEAIIARPPSTAYRVQKFIQRNKGLAFAAASITCTLVLGAVVSTGFALYANSQLDRAVAAESRLQGSLTDAQQERKKAIEERDRAVKAEAAQSELTLLAEQNRKEADAARMAESQQRQEAERQRDDAQRLKNEAVTLTTKLTASNEEQRRSLYASDMNLIRIEAQRGNIARVREILMSHLPLNGEKDLRGFEWNYWYRFLTQGRLVQMKVDEFTHGDPSSVMAVIPGGEIVAVTKGTTTELRELASGKVVGRLPVQLKRLVEKSRFSRSGRTVFGQTIAPIKFGVLVDSDENRSKSGSSECIVYEPDGTSISFPFPSESFADSFVSFLTISSDGQWIAALGNDPTDSEGNPAARLIIWNIDTRQIVLNKIFRKELSRLEFSPDSRSIAAFLTRGRNHLSNESREVVTIVDVESGNEKATLKHNDEIEFAEWLPDQQRLILGTVGHSGSNRSELLSWTFGVDSATVLSGESLPNYPQTAMSSDGRLLAVTSHTVPGVRMIDTTTGLVTQIFYNEQASVDSVTFSKDDKHLFGCSTSGEVVRWDIPEQQDPFGLRRSPLPPLIRRGFEISKDQSLLVALLTNHSIIARSRDGSEKILRKSEPQQGAIPGGRTSSTFARLTLSNDGHFLAFCSNEDEGQTLLKNARKFEIFDVSRGERLWKTIVEPRARGVSPVEETDQMLFSTDSRHLLVKMLGYSYVVFNVQTGEAETPLPVNNDSTVLVTQIARKKSDGSLLISGTRVSPLGVGRVSRGREVFQRTPFDDHDLWRSDNPALVGGGERTELLGEIVSSPDGNHLGVLRSKRQVVEFWKRDADKPTFATAGDQFLFSGDGSRVAVLTSRKIALAGAEPLLFNVFWSSTTITRFIRVNVWHVATGELLSEIRLEGLPADAVRFSADNQRLLTLHGLAPNSAGGTPAMGSLWDTESGRELFSIPIADSNLFNWEMQFSPDGNQILSVILGKVVGSGLEGKATTFDGTPLDERADAELIGLTLFEQLLAQTPLPEELLAEVNSRPQLKPMVREVVIEQIRQKGLNPAQIDAQCREILKNRFGNSVDFQRALRWAEALQKVEPNTLRTRVLLGAAHVRCGNYRKAIELLSDQPADSDSLKTLDDLGLCRDRLILLLVAEVENGATPRVYGRIFFQMMLLTVKPPQLKTPVTPSGGAVSIAVSRFNMNEAIEMIPMATRLFYIPVALSKNLQTQQSDLYWFLWTLAMPHR